jgi:hypothetical protein
MLEQLHHHESLSISDTLEVITTFPDVHLTTHKTTKDCQHPTNIYDSEVITIIYTTRTPRSNQQRMSTPIRVLR